MLGVPVIRPQVAETTALGAAYAAGLATGFWSNLEDLRQNWQIDHTWEPNMDASARDKQYAMWKKAVTRTFDWVEITSRNTAHRLADCRLQICRVRNLQSAIYNLQSEGGERWSAY